MNLPLFLLEKAAREDKLTHFLLFHGGDEQERRAAAERLALVLNCQGAPALKPCGNCIACRKILSGNHPDVGRVEPVKTSFGIEQILAWQEQVYRKHLEGNYKVFLLEQGDALTEPAANALLKVVEDPPPRTVIILSATNAEGILPTLRSRAQMVYFPPPTLDAWLSGQESHADEARVAFELGGGMPEVAGLILKHGLAAVRAWLDGFWQAVAARDFAALFPLFAKDKGPDKELAAVYLQVISYRLKQDIIAGTAAPAAARAVLDATEALQRQVNPRLVFEVLALELFQQGG